MDILIHGTKGGRRIFTPKKLPGLLDVTSDSAKATAVGQQVYAIRFTDDNIVLSKYKIIRDVRGDKRTGFIGFSLFLQHKEKLTGADTIAMLDRVSEEYCREYVVDNNLNEVIENWDFVYAISKEYENKLKPNYEKMQSGAIDDAFIYFKDADELERYFNIPYQEEYSKYRQVLFVEEELRNKPENPLNAIRHDLHADFTRKIDLNNPKYRLIIAQAKEGVEIRVKVNGIIRVNGNIIRKKDLIEISYSRSYYKTQMIDVKLDESCPDFVSVDDINETVTIGGILLVPVIKEIQISAIDSLSEKQIPNIQINCSQVSTGTNKDVNNNLIIFKGDEIGEEWNIKVISTTEEYETIELNFCPEQSNESEFVTLKKRKFLFIDVIDKKSNQLISKNDYKIKIQDEEWNKPQINDVNEKYKIVFVGEEIEKEWKIEITNSKYKIIGEKKTIIPKNEKDPSKTIKIFVEEEPRTTENGNYIITDGNAIRYCYTIKAGKNGRMIGYPEKEYDTSVGFEKIEIEAEKRAKTVTKPKLGYKYDKVSKISSSEKRFEFEAQFKPIIPLNLSSIVTMSLILVTIVFLLNRLISNHLMEIYNKNEILTYINGDSLFLDNLGKYKVNWKNQKPKEKYNFNPLTWGNGGETVNDTSKVYKEWEAILDSIDYAIGKRKLVDKLDFNNLKKLDYSSEQKRFKNAIDKIVSGYNMSSLGNVSGYTLTNIAEKIDSLTEVNKKDLRILAYSNGVELKLDTLLKIKEDIIDQALKQRIESCIALRTALNYGKTSILDTLNFQYSEEQQNLEKALTMINDENRTNVDSTMNRCSISTMNLDGIAEFIEITSYLQGTEMTKLGLNEYLEQTSNTELRTSIELALKFWTLNSNRGNSYHSYKPELQKDKILRKSRLKSFVDSADDSTKYLIDNEHVKDNKLNKITDEILKGRM